mgnify:CR=1 FL=1
MSCKPTNPSSSSPSAPDSSPPTDNSGVNDLPPMTLKEEDWEIEGGSIKFGNNEIKDEVVFLREGQVMLHESVETIRDEKGKSVDELFREVFRC